MVTHTIPSKELIIDLSRKISMRAIGRQYGVSINTVMRWFDYYNIQRLPKNIIIDKTMLNKLITNGMNISEISREINRSRSLVTQWINTYKLPKPELSKSVGTLTSDALEFIDGIVASDAWISKPNSRWCYLRLGTSFHDYARVVSEKLLSFGLDNTINVYVDGTRSTGLNFDVSTPNFIEMRSQRQRWYPNDVKAIPNDISNTSEMWKWMYVGDGHLFHNGKAKWSGSIEIATHAFSKKDQELLVSLLRHHGIRAETRPWGHGTSQWHLLIDDAWSFLKFIGNSPCEYFEYKWDLRQRPNIKCEWCSKKFDVVQVWQRYCSFECYNAKLKIRNKTGNNNSHNGVIFNLLDRITNYRYCILCQALFIPSRRDKIYCTSKCQERAHDIRRWRKSK